jgi:hypothetical protein
MQQHIRALQRERRNFVQQLQTLERELRFTRRLRRVLAALSAEATYRSMVRRILPSWARRRLCTRYAKVPKTLNPRKPLGYTGASFAPRIRLR